MFTRLSFVLLLAFALASASAQNAPVTFTAQQDQENMMQQLGIKSLRPGPSGDERAPNHANYDESKANPFPNIPDALTFNNGQKVTTPEQWQKRRAEIIEGFECCVYGRVPKDVPKVTWTVKTVDHEFVAFRPVIAKELIGHVDNSATPQIDVNIHMILVTPLSPKPVPVLIMFGQANFPAPAEPSREEFSKMNAALKALLIQQDPSLKETFEKHPAFEPYAPRPFSFPPMNADGDPPNEWELLADGWGFALLDPRVPDAAIAFDEALVRELFSGWRLIAVERGAWSGRVGAPTYQDVIVAER